jgi:hypothetical protein
MEDEIGRACSMHREMCRVLIGKPEEERPLRRPRRIWDNTKMDLRERG